MNLADLSLAAPRRTGQAALNLVPAATTLLAELMIENDIGHGEAMRLLDQALLQIALTRAAGNKSAAARTLGFHRNTLERRLVTPAARFTQAGS